MRLFKKIFFYFLTPAWLGIFPIATVQGQVITTIAGSGTGGDGGPATLAGLAGPEDIALDSQGNLYIAEANNDVRKVDTAGIITTVAGNGTPTYTGDGGAAVSASLNYPAGLAVDAQDNLYIADFYNNVVRKVSVANGIITTVVGAYPGTPGYSGDNGPATLAQLLNPQGIKFDAQGNLYISDSSNHRVRKVDAGTSIITTVVGSGVSGYSGDNGPATLASLVSPEGLAFDAAGNLFIADDGAFVVRKVAAGSGIISTVAGSATPGYSGDNGPATLARFDNEMDGIAVGCGGNLYVADSTNNRVRMVSGAPGTITTIAGAGTAGYSNNTPALSTQLNHPEALVFAHDTGDLYVANYLSGTVQRIVSYCTLTPTPTPVLTPAPTAVGCDKPIETFCFPNPASGDRATLLCNLCEAGQVSIRVYNTAAELVETDSFQGSGGVNNRSINIGGLSHGIYYYVVQAQGSTGTHKSNTAKFAVVR